MKTITVSKQTCRRIVSIGSDPRLEHVQNKRTRHLVRLFGHYTGVCAGMTQNAGRGAQCTVECGETTFSCYCPLLAPDETIKAGTVVAFQRNVTNGHWEIIAAECGED